jgi:hypothetical protein
VGARDGESGEPQRATSRKEAPRDRANVKRFAKYRRDADGKFTQRSLEEYLILATVFETCAFNNVNVLKFLLAKETTLEGLLRMAGR